MSRQATREMLLEKGGGMFIERGFTGTGIQDLLKAASVPKGSFYHYFTSKEDFGLQVIDYYDRIQTPVMEQQLGDPTLPPLQRLERFFRGMRDEFEREGCRGGCLIGKLSQELADQREVFRSRLDVILRKWCGLIAKCLDEARGRGEMDTDPFALANILMDSWEGAMLRMKATSSTEPLDAFLDFFFGTFLKASGQVNAK